MYVDVTNDIVIQQPLALVAAYATDPDNAPCWYKNIKSVEWKTEAPLTVGSQIAFVAHFLGRRMAYTYEVVEWVAAERLVMRTAEGPFPMETQYHWQTVDETSTRMTLRNHGAPAGFSRVLAPVMAGAMRRAMRKDLALLKEILEEKGPA